MEQVGRVRPSEISLVLVSLSLVGCVGAGESDPAVRVDAKLLALESAGSGSAALAADGGNVPSCATSDPNCDGIDNDCDGRLDEDFLPRCMFGAISLRCVDGRPSLVSCDDRISCTRDSCNAGACQNVPSCVDDGNPCTAESCHPELGCTSTPTPGLACDDGDACTEGDVCGASGACEPGTPPALDDGNSCTIDSCDPAVGEVVHTADVGAACDDGSACSENDACSETGVCAGQALPALDDGDACTTDACDPATGAVSHVRLAPGTSCADGDDCNGDETCQGLTELSVSVSSRHTFLRTDASDATNPPVIVRLSEAGFGPGRVIRMHTEGMYSSPARSFVYALFSATDQVLGRETLQRVPGAIQSDAPMFATGNTYFDSLSTDIPQDFQVTTSGLTLAMPEGARYLVLGFYDSWYNDNSGSLQLKLKALFEECVQGEPAPEMCMPDE